MQLDVRRHHLHVDTQAVALTIDEENARVFDINYVADAILEVEVRDKILTHHPEQPNAEMVRVECYGDAAVSLALAICVYLTIPRCHILLLSRKIRISEGHAGVFFLFEVLRNDEVGEVVNLDGFIICHS